MRRTPMVRLKKKMMVMMMTKMENSTETKKMKMTKTTTMSARIDNSNITAKSKRRLTVHSSDSARGIWTRVRFIIGNVQESTLEKNQQKIFERVWYAIASTPGLSQCLKL